jgi:hypothetical protein
VGDTAPGVITSWVDAEEPGDILRLSLPSFEIRCHHDLLTHRETFGLQAVTDRAGTCLPLLSPDRLFVSHGAQDVLARFSATGFEAAVVTAFFASPPSAVRPRPHRVKVVEVRFDRPFGFIAVHRPSRLALVAGWVISPFAAKS